MRLLDHLHHLCYAITAWAIMDITSDRLYTHGRHHLIHLTYHAGAITSESSYFVRCRQLESDDHDQAKLPYSFLSSLNFKAMPT